MLLTSDTIRNAYINKNMKWDHIEKVITSPNINLNSSKDDKLLDLRLRKQLLLAFFIINQRIRRNEIWESWMDFFPSVNSLTTALYWNNAEIKTFGPGYIKNHILQAHNSFYELDRIRFGLCEMFPHCFDINTYNTQTLKWALSIVDSRGVGAPYENPTIAPLIDFINDADQYGKENSYISISDEGNYELHALRSINPGEEITISYGELTNGRLLAGYGFARKDNPHHPVTIQLKTDYTLFTGDEYTKKLLQQTDDAEDFECDMTDQLQWELDELLKIHDIKSPGQGEFKDFGRIMIDEDGEIDEDPLIHVGKPVINDQEGTVKWLMDLRFKAPFSIEMVKCVRAMYLAKLYQVYKTRNNGSGDDFLECLPGESKMEEGISKNIIKILRKRKNILIGQLKKLEKKKNKEEK